MPGIAFLSIAPNLQHPRLSQEETENTFVSMTRSLGAVAADTMLITNGDIILSMNKALAAVAGGTMSITNGKVDLTMSASVAAIAVGSMSVSQPINATMSGAAMGGVEDGMMAIAIDDLPPPAAEHRYWRVNMTAAQAGQTVVGFKNWELRLTSGGPDETVPGGAVSASSFTSGFPASNLVDANTESIWASASGGSPWVIKYDFGAGNEKEITACYLVAYASNRGPSAFTIDYSDDDSSWTTVYTGSSVTWGGGFANLFTW